MRRTDRLAILGLAVAVLASLALIATVVIGSKTARRNTHNLAVLTHRVIQDEHRTCVIQRRGLPAGHALAVSMGDIYKLLTLKPTSQAQRLAARITPSNVKAIIADLDSHLARYEKREAKQPHTRSCGPTRR